MSPVQIVTFILEQLAKLAALAGVPYDEAMAELHKRTAVDTSELDAAAKEQDAPLG
jgi:hypothetical protein